MWSGVGGGFNSGTGFALAIFDDGNGPKLYAGGGFNVAGGTSVPGGGVVVNHIARWDGRHWSALAGGTNGQVNALAVFDEDGAGPGAPALYAAGEFTTAGGISANRIARWNGASWSALGAGLSGTGRALAVSPDSAGLFVGGDFVIADGQAANRIAAWTCRLPGDINGDGHVNISDLLELLAAWGPCPQPCPPSCAADITGDCVVSVEDFLALLANWVAQ